MLVKPFSRLVREIAAHKMSEVHAHCTELCPETKDWACFSADSQTSWAVTISYIKCSICRQDDLYSLAGMTNKKGLINTTGTKELVG